MIAEYVAFQLWLICDAEFDEPNLDLIEELVGIKQLSWKLI